MRPGARLLTVVAVQFAVLLAIIGFKQYTVWTADTVLLRTTVEDPASLAAASGTLVQYDISTIGRAELPAPYYASEVWVELQRGSDGYWHVAAVHAKRERTVAGAVLVRGRVHWSYPPNNTVQVSYGIEGVYAPRAATLPAGGGHTVAVEVRIDRFGTPTPLRFLIDGTPADLRQR